MGRSKQSLLRERFVLGTDAALLFSYVLIAAGVILLAGHASTTGLTVWAVGLGLTAPLPKLIQTVDVSFTTWFRLEVAVELITGVTWGLITVLALPASDVRQALLCAMLIGVMVAASATSSQFLSLHLSFILPFGLLTIGGYLTAPNGLTGAAAMLAVALVFSIVMAAEHRSVHENFVEVILENDGLVDELAAERDALTDANRQLDDQAWSDALTGLANRAAMMRSLSERLASLDGDDAVTVAYLDLDGFKQINDTLGHRTGDLLLIAVAERLRAVAGPDELPCRLGGDELVVLASQVDPQRLGPLLRSVFDEPFRVEDRLLTVGAGIGIASTTIGLSPDELLRRADRALYRNKRTGSDGEAWRVFDETMLIETERQRSLEDELSDAFASGAITAWFQPIVDLHDGRIVGAEALARWEHADGVRSAGAFIEAMAERGLLDELTDQTFAAALRLQDALEADGLRRLPISINVSPPQLEQVLRRHTSTDDLSAISIEITEEAAVPNPERVGELLEKARATGARVLVDDFGVGYSSLALATSLPIDGLKIDRSFVATLSTSDRATAVVSTIVDLARRLGLDIIAEGIESPTQASLLRSLGVTRAQGFLYAAAVPAARLQEWIESDHRLGVASEAPDAAAA